MEKIKTKLARTVADIRAALAAAKEWLKRLIAATDEADKALEQIGKGVAKLEQAEVKAEQEVQKAMASSSSVIAAFLEAHDAAEKAEAEARDKLRRCTLLVRKYSA